MMMNLLGFYVKRSGHSHRGTTCGQIITLGGIFSPTSRMHGHILLKLSQYRNLLLPGPHNIDDIFVVVGSKIKVTETLPDNALFRCVHNRRWFAVRDHLVRDLFLDITVAILLL